MEEGVSYCCESIVLQLTHTCARTYTHKHTHAQIRTSAFACCIYGTCREKLEFFRRPAA